MTPSPAALGACQLITVTGVSPTVVLAISARSAFGNPASNLGGDSWKPLRLNRATPCWRLRGGGGSNISRVHALLSARLLSVNTTQACRETSWRATTSQSELCKNSTRRRAPSFPQYPRFQLANRIPLLTTDC